MSTIILAATAGCVPTEGGIANELENTPDIDVDEIRKDEPEECKEGLEMPLEITVGLAAIACLVQLLFDSFAELVLKCSCFQKGSAAVSASDGAAKESVVLSSAFFSSSDLPFWLSVLVSHGL